MGSTREFAGLPILTCLVAAASLLLISRRHQIRKWEDAHCTGWRATHALAAALPDAFVPGSVGTRYILQ